MAEGGGGGGGACLCSGHIVLPPYLLLRLYLSPVSVVSRESWV